MHFQHNNGDILGMKTVKKCLNYTNLLNSLACIDTDQLQQKFPVFYRTILSLLIALVYLSFKLKSSLI